MVLAGGRCGSGSRPESLVYLRGPEWRAVCPHGAPVSPVTLLNRLACGGTMRGNLNNVIENQLDKINETYR